MPAVRRVANTQGFMWGRLLGIWQGFDTWLGLGSRLEMNTTEDCVLCVFVSRWVLLWDPCLGFVCSLTTVYAVGLTILFACTYNGIKADWKKNNKPPSASELTVIVLSNCLFCFSSHSLPGEPVDCLSWLGH